MPFLDTLSANQQTVAKVLSAFGVASTADLLAAGDDYFAAGGSQSALYDLLAGYFATNGGTAYAGYASTSTDAEFAATLVAQLTAGTSVAQTVVDGWVTVLADLLTAGAYTRGNMMSDLVNLFDSITSSTTTDADVLAVANVLDNRAEVGAAYAASSAGATFADLATVNAAVTGVTNDSASVNTAISTNFGSSMPAPTTFTVTSSINSIMEGAAAATITVTANTATYAPISFTYNVSPGTVSGVSAGSSADVQTATGTVTIPAGATSATFTITAAGDTSTEGLEALLVSVLGSTNNSVGSVTLTVQDAPGGSFTLTTAADNVAGTVGDDVISGTIAYASATAVDSSSTLTAGDIINGGSGTDTLNITVSGSNLTLAATTGAASPNVTNVEKILVTNVASGTEANQTISLALASGVTTVGTSASTTKTVTTEFTNVGSLAAVEMTGVGGLKVGYTNATVSAGTADAVSVTLKGVGTKADDRSTLNLATGSVETLNITSSTGSNYLTISDSGMKTLNVSGDKSAYIATPATVTKVDMSAATASQTVDLGAVATVSAVTVTGGAGTADTLVLGTAVTAATDLKNVSGIEVLKTTGVNVSLAADVAGISTIDLSGTGVEVATFTTGYTAATTVKIGATGADSVVNSSAANITVSGNTADFAGRTITGNALTVRQLAKLLAGYGIRTRTVRIDKFKTYKGYYREDFVDAFARYLTPENDPDLRHIAPEALQTGAVAVSDAKVAIRILPDDPDRGADVEDTYTPRANDTRPALPALASSGDSLVSAGGGDDAEAF